MKLKDFRVTKYRSIVDSGLVSVEPLTVVVGKNESGKTTLLRALHKLNPATPDPYDIEREWPRGRRRERDPKQVVCTATFALDDEERAELAEVLGLEEGAKGLDAFTVTRDYAGLLEVQLAEDVGLDLDALHPNQVDAHCATLPIVPDNVSPEFREVAIACRSEVLRLAGEGRFASLSTLHKEHHAKLSTVVGAGTPLHGLQNQHLDQHVAALQQLGPKLASLETPRKQVHEYLVERLPRFVYMSDYRAFGGFALLDQVQQRRNKNRLSPDDETFLMILQLSGLDLNSLVEQGNTDDREGRQYDLDDGARTLTGQFKQRLKQREYTVQFRADGQQFYTMVTDQTDQALIRLEERSKGFQWFFSFDLLFMHESAGTFENCVILLDEPGLHLHPGAQTDLLARFAEYARGNTLIYSTHLPFMLDLHHPERIRVINEGEHGPTITEDLTQSQPEAKLTLQAALGMSGRQSYLVAHRNVVVEGVDDYMLVNELSQLLWRSGQEGLPEDVMITPAGGASEAAYIATFMIGQGLDVAVLLDSDTAGDTARDKLVKSWLSRYSATRTEVIRLSDAVGETSNDFAIEDVFEPEFYLARVNEVYAKQLAAAGVAKLELVGGGQLGKRVQRALDAHDIAFNKGSIAKRIRRDMSQMKSIKDLPKETQARARKLITALASALETPELGDVQRTKSARNK